MPLFSDLPITPEALFNLENVPLLDIQEALRNLGDEAVVVELLQLMIRESIPDDLALMHTAYKEKNWDKIQQLAHKMKGGAIYVGTVRMKIACQYLERYWKSGQSEGLELLYEHVLNVISETLKEIENWLKNNGDESERHVP